MNFNLKFHCFKLLASSYGYKPFLLELGKLVYKGRVCNILLYTSVQTIFLTDVEGIVTYYNATRPMFTLVHSVDTNPKVTFLSYGGFSHLLLFKTKVLLIINNTRAVLLVVVNYVTK